jgi:hypothetical protein
MKRLVILSILAGTASTPFAGVRNVTNVTVNTTSMYAAGSIGTARNSADTVQYIGCTVTLSRAGSGNAPWAFCAARSTSGSYATCATEDATLVSQIQSIHPNSYIYFNFNNAGDCLSIGTSNFSYYEPVAP